MVSEKEKLQERINLIRSLVDNAKADTPRTHEDIAANNEYIQRSEKTLKNLEDRLHGMD